jgi:multiple antibiotic resistance protein
MSGLAFFSVCFPTLLSIVDPLGVVPAYLALVGKEGKSEPRGIAIRATLTVTVVLMLFAMTGNQIFKFFGITVPAFKIAGGILLFTMGLEMIRARFIQSRSTPEEASEAQTKEDVALIPLGIPLLSGPGAIATVMVWSAKAHQLPEKLALYGSILLVALLTLLTLLFAPKLARIFGKTGINVVTRIMGLILASTAAQFVIDGVREAFKVSG